MADISDEEIQERIRRAQLAREEARNTIDEQSETLSDIDEKAIQIFRINVVVASILASGVSIAVSAEYTTIETLMDTYTKLGCTLLFLSTLCASVTYTSTSERIGINGETIEDEILNRDYDYDLVEEAIALAYRDMIQYNYRKNASNALYFTITLFAAVASIVYLAFGVAEIYNPDFNSLWLDGVVILFFIGFGKASGLYGTLIRWRRLTTPYQRMKQWGLSHLNKGYEYAFSGKDS
jgi:hypothetical protein